MNFKKILIASIILCFPLFSLGSANQDSLLNALSRTIDKDEVFIHQKYDRIGKLQDKLEDKNLSSVQRFSIYNKIYNEYRPFKYDSAFGYAVKLQVAAQALRDPIKISFAKLKLSFTLLSTGMYKEALDSLKSVSLNGMPDSIKAEYYGLMARGYYDLAGYTQDAYYSAKYINFGEKYVDSALTILGQNSLQYYALRGMKREISGKSVLAQADFKTILTQFSPSLNQYAMASNSLGNIFYKKGEENQAIELMAQAALADLKGSVKEGVALMTLAEFLYRKGDKVRAYAYIKQALKDADYYGAKQRKIQIGSILPIIEGERLATVEKQRRHLLIYGLVVTFLSLLVVIFAIIIFRQLKQLRAAKNAVTEAYSKLQETTDKLIEANRIKEEYIGYSFNNYSEYLDKVEKFKKSIDKKLMAKQYDDINYVMKSINLKKEREALYQNFDKIFIRLFPNFLKEFNSFFREEDRIIQKDNESLTIELRIFALIRLGINEHEQIARLLEYSVNTIYTYKTKVKNRSILPNEEFEKRVMEIKAF